MLKMLASSEDPLCAGRSYSEICSSVAPRNRDHRRGRLASTGRSGSRSMRSTTHLPCHEARMVLVAVRREENTAASPMSSTHRSPKSDKNLPVAPSFTT